MFPAAKSGRFRAFAACALALVASALLPGCLTCAMWEKFDHSNGERAAAVVLTPVTVAVDAAFIVGYAYASSCGNGGCGGCWSSCHHGCR